MANFMMHAFASGPNYFFAKRIVLGRTIFCFIPGEFYLRSGKERVCSAETKSTKTPWVIGVAAELMFVSLRGEEKSRDPERMQKT